VSEKKDKIIAARKKLRERFLARDRSEANLGSGPPNRHGQAKLPPGQTESKKWPVLDMGVLPKVSKESFRLELRGLCHRPHSLNWQDLMSFEQVEETSDFHCVTTWSKMDLLFRGVRLIDIVLSAGLDDSATHIMCYGLDGYCTNLSLEEALKDDVLLVTEAEGEALSLEHGGPVRMITPQLYAWKGAKWICAVEFMDENRPGFWEKNGYSMGANPWLEDRYS
jgi:DMSO/TMAO reductase YedYZ molybdopterin-dependent catalytic subunit